MIEEIFLEITHRIKKKKKIFKNVQLLQKILFRYQKPMGSAAYSAE